jgi:hypothetical protein
MRDHASTPINRSERPEETPLEGASLSWTERLATPFRCLPDFLVIGAQKSGTTSLTACLDRNPGVWIARCKECNFLSGPRRSAGHYRRFFPTRWTRRSMERTAGNEIMLGEGTPYDLFHPRAAHEATRVLDDPRIVILLRDPVARAYSHHRHCVRLGLEHLDFETAVAAEPGRIDGEAERLERDPMATSHNLRHHSYVARGHYARQIRRWQEAVGGDRIHIEISEHLFERPQEALARIESFLGIPKGRSGAFEHRNPGTGGTPISERMQSELRSTYRESNRDLSELLNIELPWPR